MPKMIKIDKLSNTAYRLYIYSDKNSKKIIDLIIGNIYKITYFNDINDKVSDVGQLRKVTINNSTNKFTIVIAKEDKSQIKILSTNIDNIVSSSFLDDNKNKGDSFHGHDNMEILDTFNMTQNEILNQVNAKINNKLDDNIEELKSYIDEQIATGDTGMLDGGEL